MAKFRFTYSGGFVSGETKVAPGDVFDSELLEQPVIDNWLKKKWIEPAGAETEAPKPEKKIEVKKVEKPAGVRRWDFTTELHGMTLAQLNNLIDDHSAKLKEPAPPPFETAQEALAFLQQDLPQE